MNEIRISKLRDYLFNIIDTLTTNNKYQINADFLGGVGDFSLDKIPTESLVEKWIIGKEIHKEVYSFKGKKAYSQDTLNNLFNIGFFEDLQYLIEYYNKKGILPNIDGILSIECLNCGTLNSADNKTAIFDIQIQITFINKEREVTPSL